MELNSLATSQLDSVWNDNERVRKIREIQRTIRPDPMLVSISGDDKALEILETFARTIQKSQIAQIETWANNSVG